MIVGVFSAIFQDGGVQRFSRQLMQGLDEWACTYAEEVRLLSLSDPAGEQQFEAGERSIPVLGFGGSKRKLTQELLALRPHAQLIYFGHPGLAMAGWIAQRAGLSSQPRYLVHMHGIEVWQRMGWLRRQAMQGAVCLSASSHFSIDEFKAAHPENNTPCSVLYPTLDPDSALTKLKFENCDERQQLRLGAREKLGLKPEEFVGFCLARLAKSEKGKGIDTAIGGFAKAVSQCEQPGRFIIAGGGDDIPRLQQVAADHEAADAVTFPGRISDDELLLYYQAADVFIMPSSKEGFGIVFLEAMAAGLPVIAGNTGGSPELVVEGETGFLSGQNDLDLIAGHLSDLLQSPERCFELGMAGRKRAESQFFFDAFQTTLNEIVDPFT
jgi:glycosyltransferase involved in cell wall biosynthesis